MVPDREDFTEILEGFPEALMSAVAARDLSSLPQFGSCTLSIDCASDLGNVCTATDKDPNKYMRSREAGGDVIYSAATHQL